MTERHRHYWVHMLDAGKPRLTGRQCHGCGREEPDVPMCVVEVWTSEGLATFQHRCFNRGSVQYVPRWNAQRRTGDRYHPDHLTKQGLVMPEGGWWYCGTHSPERLKAAEAKRKAANDAEWEIKEARWALNSLEAGLGVAAERWYDTSIEVGEEFCDACEHHPCVLAREVLEVRRGRAMLEQLKDAHHAPSPD